MFVDPRHITVSACRLARRTIGLCAALLALCVLAGSDSADPPDANVARPSAAASGPRSAHLVRVPLPIGADGDVRVKGIVNRLLEDVPEGGPRPVLILEFWIPPGESGRGSEFERSLSLAKYLTSDRVSRARTVAFLPQSAQLEGAQGESIPGPKVQGHAVLVALACEDIVMHEAAEIGDAGIDETTIDPLVRQSYSLLAGRRRTIPPPVAIGMLDPSVAVVKADTDNGVRYVFDGELEALKAESVVTAVETIIPTGETGRFTGSQMRVAYNFASHLAASRSELAQELGLSEVPTEAASILGEGWTPVQVELKGPLNRQLVASTQRCVKDLLAQGSVNFLCVWIDSRGGPPADGLQLAQYLASLDSSRVRTVAYVSGEARGVAALVALACDHVVMGRAAVLGGPSEPPLSEEECTDLLAPIAQLAAAKGRGWSLPASMMGPDLPVHSYTPAGSSLQQFFCEDELAQQTDPERWIQGAEITTPGAPLELNGLAAERFGLVRFIADDFKQAKTFYGLEIDPPVVELGWAHQLIEALASPPVAGGLLFIAGFALMAELMSPGIGVGGFVATVCYVLYFWSQFMHGTANSLEVLLFIMGIAFVALEIFVIPGFGIFGLGGGALIVVSLVLAAQTFVIPNGTYEREQLLGSLTVIASTGGGLLAGLFVLRRYLDRAPFLSQVMLVPPAGEDLEELGHREQLVDLEYLLGQQGTTTTPLTPSGKAMFGDRLVDVICEGKLVESESRVRVIEVVGSRVLVQEVN